MDWFEKLTGFRETGYAETRTQLEIHGNRLHSRSNGANYGIGELELASLRDLRVRARSAGGVGSRLKVSVVNGDVRRMHRSDDNAGALFQVASQFNLLEMVSPDVTPEHGVRRRRIRQSRRMDPCRHAAGLGTGERLRSRCEGCELREAIEGDADARRGVSVTATATPLCESSASARCRSRCGRAARSTMPPRQP
jgi:hypothetical protein